ncbi:amidophosphoribosyltransferase [Dermatobacter hominis]|uniref:amidophosphoribosyltransferase n=1 Tax=Dermatobacter hominis TaxID=2884263 RepID=UPI001D1106FA|nr:amidophosphoribosyltransferase [Dermatobacter hominis]UDY34092.1 amidophosphoribosyltransferase [Dermatobacter hominis]
MPPASRPDEVRALSDGALRADEHLDGEPTEPELIDPEAGKPREACGVFGVYAPGSPVAHLAYLGIYALQHRGQESAGIASSNGDHLTVVKEMGLVSNVFDDRTLAALDGDLAIGHTRYSTTGSSMWKNSQPVFRDVGQVQFALAHNGNLVNTAQLVEEAGMLPGTVSSDTDAMAEVIAQACDQVRAGDDVLERALLQVLPRFDGAFSLVLMDRQRVIGLRDPHGFRPLCLGKLDSGWVLASETPALDVVGAHFVRELDPGEMVVIDGDGVRSLRPFDPASIDPKLCLFEFVYFARPDSQLYDRNVHQARVRMGERLADQAPVDADMVMGVPESGIPAAEGFARRSGVPFGHGLVKNRYIGRTFIAPSQEMRALGVRMKLNPLRENIDGRRLVVVDDSIVRGTTTKAMVSMLREAGAREVHLRVSSPPYRWPCFYGMDTGTRGELLAANLEVEEIRRYLNVDTLSYLTLDRLVDAIGAPGAGFCDACLTGTYPVEIPVEIGKAVLDGGAAPGEEEGVSEMGSVLLEDAGLLPSHDAAAGDRADG